MSGETPKVVQIFGSEPDVLKKVVEDFNINPNIDIIDFNLGCPAHKVVKNGDGSELLKDLDKVEILIKEIMSVAKKPVTVNTRAGYNDKLITAVDVAIICEKYGVSAITIHGRTKAQGYFGKADLEIIRKVKESVSIPVIGNGDVVDIKSAYEMFEKTGVDAIMIGRAAFGNPWIFKSIVSGKYYIPSLDEKKQCILEHFRLAVKRDSERVAVPTFRKHVAWYLKGLRNNSFVRDKINKMTVAEDVEDAIINYFKELENEQD